MSSKNELGKKDETRNELRAAIYHALLHLEENYDSTPSTDQLAKLVGLSTFHFHRAFKSVVGETVAKYHQRIRIERAAAFLKSSNWQISDIALSCGFETPASFARAFKRLYGKSPGEFRETEGTVPFLRGYLRSRPERQLPSPEFSAPTVAIEDWPTLELITLRFVGPVHEILAPWSELLSWARKNISNLEQARFFGLWFDDWSQLGENRYRYECAILPPEPISHLSKPFAWRSIPAGQVATAFARGTLNEVDRTWKAFTLGWLPFSGFQPRVEFGFDEYESDLVLAPFPKKLLLTALGDLSIKLCFPVHRGPYRA